MCARCYQKTAVTIFELYAFVHVCALFVVGNGTAEVQWVCRVQFPVVWNLSWCYRCDMTHGVVSHSLERAEKRR